MLTVILIVIGIVIVAVGLLDNLIFHQGYIGWLDMFYVAALTYLIAFVKEY